MTLNKQHNQNKEIIINVEYKLYRLNFYTYLTAFACVSIFATCRDIIILQKSDVKRRDYVFCKSQGINALATNFQCELL